MIMSIAHFTYQIHDRSSPPAASASSTEGSEYFLDGGRAAGCTDTLAMRGFAVKLSAVRDTFRLCASSVLKELASASLLFFSRLFFLALPPIAT
jgi:hypothetical protein